MLKVFSVVSAALGVLWTSDVSGAESTFSIVIERDKPTGSSLPGTLTVNGQVVGATLENAGLRIAAGEYTGSMRYVSGRNFVQGPFGSIASKGDFLIEVTGVKGRTDILMHGGSRPGQSQGCILLGGVQKTATGARLVPDETTLRKLRLRFYGSETPDGTPAVSIVVSVRDAEMTASSCNWEEAAGCVDVASRRGTRCSQDDSMEIDYVNRCPFPIKAVSCMRRTDGRWNCTPDGEFDDGLGPSKTKNNYECHSNGTYKVFAMPIDKFLSGKCRYPKTVSP